MDFTVVKVLNNELKIDDTNLNLFRKGDIGSRMGVNIEASLINYRNQLLSIGVKFELLVDHNKEAYPLSSLSTVSMFYFNDNSLLTRGKTSRAINAIQNCFDQAQAHCFGTFWKQSENLEFPIFGTNLLAPELLQNDIQKFLMKITKMKK